VFLHNYACIVLPKKPQSSGSVITCNDIPLVRETVQEPDAVDDDDNFVYDVYHTNDDQFDFESLQHVLAIQALRCSSHLLDCFLSFIVL